ncbi:MAG TPA: zinc finger domain-containing protein, partial [Thermomonas sp.]|uniref:zinc finger domain-containing protein n=1 Tax=Thermomonas sp. TaxID=1971895 RepID=UPI002B9619C9
TWFTGLAALPEDAPLAAKDFEGLLELREQVTKALEPVRAEGKIGAALEADIELHCSVADQNWLSPLAEELRFLLISGDVRVVPNADAKGVIGVLATPTSKPKCVRCWHHREDIGTHATHPLLCGRCVSNVDGAGEVRKWF